MNKLSSTFRLDLIKSVSSIITDICEENTMKFTQYDSKL